VRRVSGADFALPAAVVLGVIVIASRGIGSGLATHGDSRTIIEQSVPAILRGSYFPSRSYGNPLYEYAAAALYPAGGLFLTSLYSLLLAVAAVCVFDRLLDARIRGLRRLCALAALSFSPLFLINAFAVTEWMQTTLLFLCLLWCTRRWSDSAGIRALVGMAIFSVLLVLTRPDMAIVCACVCAAVLWHVGFAPRRIAALGIAMFVGGAVTFLVFVLLNHGLGFIRSGIIFDQAPYSRRLIIAIVGVFSVFGFLAPFILLSAGARLLLRQPESRAPIIRSLWAQLFVVAAPIIFVRFVFLPDKLEYIMSLLVLATLLVAHEDLKPVWLVLYALSTVLPSIITLSIFQRTGAADHLSLRPRLGPGAVEQEITAMRYNWTLMTNPTLLQQIAHSVYKDRRPPQPRIRSMNWAAGLLSDSGDLIIGEADAYHLDNPRGEPKYQRRLYADIYLCDHSVWVNGSFGWRLAEPPVSWPSSAAGGSLNLVCHLEHR
jgi:hypothetical protein